MNITASNQPATKAATKAWHAENRTKAATHTPGPWTIEAGNEYRMAGANGQTVFLIGDNRRLIPMGHDARLIASAPELLAACQSAIAWANDVPHPYREFPFIQQIRAAIAKVSL